MILKSSSTDEVFTKLCRSHWVLPIRFNLFKKYNFFILSRFRQVSPWVGVLTLFCPNALGKYKQHMCWHMCQHMCWHMCQHMCCLYFPRAFGQNRVRTPTQGETCLKRLKMKKLYFLNKLNLIGKTQWDRQSFVKTSSVEDDFRIIFYRALWPGRP